MLVSDSQRCCETLTNAERSCAALGDAERRDAKRRKRANDGSEAARRTAMRSNFERLWATLRANKHQQTTTNANKRQTIAQTAVWPQKWPSKCSQSAFCSTHPSQVAPAVPNGRLLARHVFSPICEAGAFGSFRDVSRECLRKCAGVVRDFGHTPVLIRVLPNMQQAPTASPRFARPFWGAVCEHLGRVPFLMWSRPRSAKNANRDKQQPASQFCDQVSECFGRFGASISISSACVAF